jgi:hypothetical protein
MQMNVESEYEEMDRAYREWHEKMGHIPKFWCSDCSSGFDEPSTRQVWDAYDAYGSYAVSYFDVQVCPRCYNEEFEEVDW